jgi:hypothetical protein
MSQLNMFSIESIDTYNKFKLQDGNLYMNNSRVGIEEFKSGKNIEISNHMFNLTDNVNISGNMTVDGVINANQIVMDFFEVPDAKIDRLDNIDISTEHIRSNHLYIETNGFTIDAGDLSFHTNDICMNSRYISICAEDIYINDGFWIQKYGAVTVSNESVISEIFTDIVNVKRLVVTDNITLPPDVTATANFTGPSTAESDFTVKGVFYTTFKIDADGSNSLVGTNTISGENTLTGSTTIDNLQLTNGIVEDLSVSRLNVTSECDIFIENGNTFRIRNAYEISMVNIYDWLPDSSNNLYYNDGNIVIGSIANSFDASLNVFGPVDIVGDLYVTKTIFYGAGGVTSSDIRLKSNINDLTNGLDVIRKIKPKLYDKKCGSGHIKESGVIAQDILEIDELNYLVREHKGMYGLNYNSLHMYSLLAIQELDKKMDRLIESVEKSMALIEQKLNILYNMRR